jgi:hypothetical protein
MHPEFPGCHYRERLGDRWDLRVLHRVQPLDALEEDLFLAVPMLISVQDVPSSLKNPAGNGCDEAWSIWAME